MSKVAFLRTGRNGFTRDTPLRRLKKIRLLPVVSTVREVFQKAINEDFGDLNMTAAVKLFDTSVEQVNKGVWLKPR